MGDREAQRLEAVHLRTFLQQRHRLFSVWRVVIDEPVTVSGLDLPNANHLRAYGLLTGQIPWSMFSRSSKSKLCSSRENGSVGVRRAGDIPRRLHTDVCLAGLSDFALERG
jgi:hypothetical protein